VNELVKWYTGLLNDFTSREECLNNKISFFITVLTVSLLPENIRFCHKIMPLVTESGEAMNNTAFIHYWYI